MRERTIFESLVPSDAEAPLYPALLNSLAVALMAESMNQ